MAAMGDQDSLLRTTSASTILGNKISMKMVEFLNKVKDQPVGFHDLGLDFLSICQILNSLEGSLKEHFRTNQPFPKQAIPELLKVLTKTVDDFTQLQNLLQKFMDYEKGGTFAKLQKTWRLVFADKDIAKIRGSLQANRGALNMTMLLTNINPTSNTAPMGSEYDLLAARLDQQGLHAESAPAVDTPTHSELEGSAFFRHEAPGMSELDDTSSYATSVTALTPTTDSSAAISPTSDEIQTPSISEMSLIDRPSASSVVSSIEPRESSPSQPSQDDKAPTREVQVESTPVGDQKGAAGEAEIDRGHTEEDHPARKSLPTIKVDRSKLPKRTPKMSPGPNVAALQKTLLAAIDGRKAKIIEQLLDRGIPPPTEPGRNCMTKSIHHPDLAILKLLLDFGADPDAKDEYGRPLLRICSEHREEAAVKMLLEYGANPDFSAPDYTAMPWAIHTGSEGIVSLLLRYGSDPGFIMKNGYTSLTYAAEKRGIPLSILREMFDYGADPNAKNGNGHTGLRLAIIANLPDHVKLLLSSGADPNLAAPELPVVLATRFPECLSLLISAGADIRAYKGLMELSTWHNQIECVKLLLDAGVNPNDKHKDVYSPLTTAIRDNHLEIITLLLSKGADPDLKGEGVPLFMAVRNPAALKELLAGGADLKKCTGILETAVYNNKIESCQILIEAGVPVEQKMSERYTPLTTSIRDNHPEIMDLLLSKGADPNFEGEGLPINMALSKPELLTKLLAAGCDPNKAYLEKAVANNKIESVQILLDAGINPNVPFKDGWGTSFTALTTAIRDNRIDILKLLLSREVNVNAPGQGLPIVNAASYNDSERLRVVLDAGADVNLKFKGQTALMKACEENRMDNVKLLLKAGADMDAVDDKGNTAMDLAASKGHDEIVMLLLDGGIE